MKKTLFLFLLCSFGVINAASERINSVSFNGLIHISTEMAFEMIDIKEGDPLDLEKIDRAVKKLYSQKYFKDIVVEDVGNGNLIFHFKEKPTIAKITIDGVGVNDLDVLLEVIEIKKGQVFDVSKAEKAQDILSKYFEAKGYFDTVTKYETEELNSGSMVLTYTVNRGEEIFIDQINLSGASNLEYSEIEPVIANKEAEILPWMWGFNDGRLRVDELPREALRIENKYKEKGYLDAKVGKPFLKAHLDSYTADITYKVEEGRQYTTGKIEIVIPERYKSEFTAKKLRKNMKLREGMLFNISRLRKDMKRMRTIVADYGYAYAKILPNIDKNKESGIAEVKFTVVPNDKVYINDVRISGNSKTIDRVVRRDVYLAPGDLYNASDLTDSKKALGRTSYFETVNIKENRVSKDKIDIIVEVEERSTSSIGGGIGYGSGDGVIFNANLSDDNIFGSGMKASVVGETGDQESDLSISLTNPRFNDSEWSLGGSIYQQEEDYYDYDEESIGFDVTVGRRFARNWTVRLTYGLEESDLSDIDPLLSSDYVDWREEGTTIKSYVIPALIYNNTDSGILPREGIKAKISTEYAGIGGDEEFIKTTGKFSTFYGLRDQFDMDVIFRYRATAKYVSDEGYLPINEKIYMGGRKDIRGYEKRSIAPKNEYGKLEGGTAMAANSFELSFPLIERVKMRGTFFYDYGGVGYNDFDIDRAGAGFQLEWISPMGPITLIFAQPIDEEDGDRTSEFEFAMGTTF